MCITQQIIWKFTGHINHQVIIIRNKFSNIENTLSTILETLPEKTANNKQATRNEPEYNCGNSQQARDLLVGKPNEDGGVNTS